jgi:hypothetical protein
MRFPTWSRLAYLMQRYCHGAPLIDGLYAPEVPCGKQQPLCSLTETGPAGAESPGVKNKWICDR